MLIAQVSQGVGGLQLRIKDQGLEEWGWRVGFRSEGTTKELITKEERGNPPEVREQDQQGPRLLIQGEDISVQRH